MSTFDSLKPMGIVRKETSLSQFDIEAVDGLNQLDCVAEVQAYIAVNKNAEIGSYGSSMLAKKVYILTKPSCLFPDRASPPHENGCARFQSESSRKLFRESAPSRVSELNPAGETGISQKSSRAKIRFISYGGVLHHALISQMFGGGFVRCKISDRIAAAAAAGRGSSENLLWSRIESGRVVDADKELYAPTG
ncbi:hypothetical protein E4U21_002080 [Claviceps maximensis]|nr:hypothetical protein E4U21_002080 [Claviceps maximensis]